MVIDGRGNRSAADQRKNAAIQLHQRRRRERKFPAAEKYHGLVAGAGMPAPFCVAGTGIRLRAADQACRRSAAASCGDRSGSSAVSIAGPDEATAIGNILVQAIGLGVIKSLDQARQIVRNSFEVKRFEPRQTNSWEVAAARFQQYAV